MVKYETHHEIVSELQILKATKNSCDKYAYMPQVIAASNWTRSIFSNISLEQLACIHGTCNGPLLRHFMY
jgi:hypothetical protein